jgi:hypothetical protein
MNSSLNALALLAAAILFPIAGHAEFQLPDQIAAQSVSGQFAVVGASEMSPLAFEPVVLTNADLVHLEPALLAVSAERIKDSIWHNLGISGNWSGRIYLALHPAGSLDEDVNIVATRFVNSWNYCIELPDVVSQTRLTRAITGAVLLELANRNAGPHCAEIPAWMVDGFSQRVLASGEPGTILSPPDKVINGLLENRLTSSQSGVDPLAGARRVLQLHFPLTFEQLSWPTESQLTGDDGGVYRASAELFVGDLLRLRDGSSRMRVMLSTLSGCYNWQTAFRSAFQRDFPRPVDLEKWWALEAVTFMARDAGPAWTPEISCDKLDEILSVPVEMRPASNSLPIHAEVSIQVVIRSFSPDRQSAILENTLRDLELAQLRMAPPVAVLSDAYRRALAEYLGQDRRGTHIKRLTVSVPVGNRDAILNQLDQLDARRRSLASASQPVVRAQ